MSIEEVVDILTAAEIADAEKLLRKMAQYEIERSE
jgi:hypothetical protein